MTKDSKLWRKLIAVTTAATLGVTGVAVLTASSAQASSRAGGTLVYVTNANQLNHLDPQRVYTGEDIAFLNTYLFRSLVSYKPVAGAGGQRAAD